MLKKIKLKNFKCFEDIEFELGNVNLLAGSNGCGKSSFIQALLLLRQSIERDKDLQSLELYGHYINLGLAKDIIYEDADVAVVNKPQGMVVHPSAGHTSGTLVNALMYHVKDLSSIKVWFVQGLSTVSTRTRLVSL